MPKTYHLPAHSAPFCLRKLGAYASFYRALLSALALVVIIGVGLVLILTPQSLAQENPGNRESALDRKADKLLQAVRKARTHDADLKTVRPEIGRSSIEALSRIVGVRRNKEGRVLVDVAVKLTGTSDAELNRAGFFVSARIDDIATLEVDVERLEELASLATVDKISAAVRRYPANDRAREAIQIENLQGQRFVTQTGQGVIVAIIDTGIDFRHADFTVPGSSGHQTRIKALLDMTVYGAQSPDPGWNYVLPGQSAAIGHLYTESDLNAALQLPKPADQNADSVKQRDKNGHGTHVAGSAAGNGLSSPTVGTYNGMAPEADLIIVKASRQNDDDASFLTTDIINALQFVEQKAGELNKPFVINLSLGGQVGPHDGTTPDERAIDSLVNSGPGRVVCVAAGNEGQASIHARATVPAGGDLTLDFNVGGAADIVDLYQAHADRFSVTVTSPDGVTLGPVAYDANGFTLPNGQASNPYLHLFNANDNKGDSDPNNDQPDIVLLFNPGAPTGIWKIKLQDADSNANQDFDAWSEGDDVYFLTNVDNLSHLIASPGAARRAITVGAFATRAFNYGSPAPFTSPGPTADGRQKPDISAPGYYLYSARSTDVADPNFGIIGGEGYSPTDSVHYTGLAGTSMSTAVTAGSVALFMQSDLTLASDQIKLAIQNTASPGYAPGWDRQYGFGKLNTRAAIELGGGPTYTISGHITGSVLVTFTLTGSQTGVEGLDSQGNYQFRNLRAGGTYTVTPQIQSPFPYVFTPQSWTFTDLRENKTADFSVALITHTISGRITDIQGNGLAGIWVGSFFNPPVFTDANGYYVMAGLTHGSSQRIRPESQDFQFDPVEYSILQLFQDQIINFTARPFLKITGRVTDENGVGLPDAYVSVISANTNNWAYTNSAGNYQIDRLPSGLDYTVVTEGFNRTFTPAGVVLPNLSANQTVNFTRLPSLGIYNIGGRISDSNSISLVGVRVNLSGDGSGAILTNSNGFYHFNVEPGRNYTVTPSSSTTTFAPLAVSFTDLASDQMVDFVSQPANSQSQIRFASEVFSATEGGSANFVTVIRLGSNDNVATVNYATSDNAGLNNCNLVNHIASSRCDYVTSVGVLTFAPGEVSKTISIPIVHDAFLEGFESFNVRLSDAVGATLSNNISASVNITDTWNSSRLNPIGETAFFVRQHYIDFLGREPDPPGFTGWQNVINNCAPGDTSCDRIHVSKNFYQSPEFQQRGYFVYRFYPVSLGRKPDYAEFVPDLARVSGFLDAAQLEAAKVAFVDSFMARSAFVNKYNSLNDTQFVDTLGATAGVTLANRQALIDALSAGTKTRAQILREIVESNEVSEKYFNQAFVVMQYFGYLRRDPDAFYLDWIQVLNTTGDSRGMISGFVNSLEYRFRFGP